MRLPGRDGELVAIGELPASDGPRVLVFEGAPGIGKTALLDEAAVQADERGQVVMSGRCTLFERAHPFSLFLDFLGDGELFDEFRPPQGWSECVDQTRYRALGRALHAALASAAADRGMLVTLDDIHLADPSSVLLLAALLRHKLPDSVRFVLAFRTGRAQARLESALGALSPAPPRHRLGPLDDDAVCGLYPSATPHRRRALLSASGGNPGYLHILADLPTATGARLGSASARPVDVGAMTHRAATIAAELRGLPAEARMVAQTAAVLGESVHPDDLAAVHGAAVAPAIDLLAELDILDGGGLLTFRHPLVRSVAYWMAAPHWRIETHRRAADHLRAAGASAAGYARHVAASAGIGDHGAVSVLTAAARTLADREPAVAADWLAIGIRIEGERVDAGADRVGRATLLALPALDATDPVVRRELMDRAAALLAGATDDELVAALGALPTLLWAEFHGEHGDWVYRRVAALADRYDCRQITAELSLLRSAMAIRRGQLADGMRYAEDAAASGTAAQRAMAAELVVAPLLWQCGRTRARAALAAVPAAHSDTWWSRAGTHGRAEVLLALGEPVAARAVLAAALRRGGAPDPQRPGRLAAAALAALATGDLDAAIEWHREAVVAADAGGLPTQVGTASMAAAQVHLARGASVAAADSVTRAVDAFERAASPIPLGHARLLAGRVAAAREDVAASRRELALAKELFSAHGAHWLVVQATAGQCGLGARLPRHPTDHNGLSNRERDIAGLVSEGMSNRGIAEHLHLSVRTVECHVSRIFTKVGVTSRTALVRQIGNAQRV